MPNNRKLRQVMRSYGEVLQSLPTVNCKGLCQASCGPIAECTTDLELMILEQATGEQVVLATNPSHSCPLLKNGRCSVHEVRPIICRMFGVVDDEHMRCPYGCEPARWVSNSEARRIFNKAIELSKRFFGKKAAQ